MIAMVRQVLAQKMKNLVSQGWFDSNNAIPMLSACAYREFPWKQKRKDKKFQRKFGPAQGIPSLRTFIQFN